MGKFLHKHHETPDTVISSTANRAISTARLLLHEMDFSLTEINESDHLYHASVQTLLNEISKVSSETNVAYVFGHNPGLSDLVTYLSGEPTMLKTCCVAILELQVDNWDELSQDTCLLLKYLSPKQI